MRARAEKQLQGLFPALLRCLPFALILSGFYGLEYFGRKRMGMMRYLVFMKREFENGWFRPAFFTGLTALALALTLFALWGFWKGRRQSLQPNRGLLGYWLASLAVLDFWLLMPALRGFKSYHFVLIGWLVLAAVIGLATAYARLGRTPKREKGIRH